MGLFVSRGCALSLVLLEPHPLIHHSLIQYHLVSEMVEEMVIGVGVRSSELDMGLWSSDNLVGLELDTAMSKPFSSSSKKPFHALMENCVLEEKHMKRFRKLFQFLSERKVRLPHLDEKACAFAHGQACFYEATFLCGLQFPIHPYIHELLGHLKIAPG